jgi:hypothetical protein
MGAYPKAKDRRITIAGQDPCIAAKAGRLSPVRVDAVEKVFVNNDES